MSATPRLDRGTVALVGAGPGAFDLLTIRAARMLAEADVVVYDALVDPAVLALSPTARRAYVGKRAGRPAVSQGFINRLLVRLARQGHRVVRLKGGDPFVFGRGGEEALALAAAGVRFEIVPGVTSATAAAALAGIPVTHRGLSSGFLVVTGHSAKTYAPILSAVPPQSLTLVVMMGLAQVRTIAALLMSRGWNGGTPAAVLTRASTDKAETFVTTLAALGNDSGIAAHEGPGTVVIGDVVRVRHVALGIEHSAEAHHG